VNLVPGTRLTLSVDVLMQTCVLTAAPVVVLPVVSAVTDPLRASARVPEGHGPDPAEFELVAVVDFPFTHLTVLEDSEVVPLLLPDPPVFPVQPESLYLKEPAEGFIDPLNAEQEIPFGVFAAAGPELKAVMPTIGTRAAQPVTLAKIIRFLRTFMFSFISWWSEIGTISWPTDTSNLRLVC